jgi:phosphatidylglycerol:prolipoprotein diacylglycerol transferase
MHPKLIQFGDFFLPTYGVLIALAFLAGVWITQRLARRSGLDTEAVVNLAVYCALAGLAGGKLFMFVFDFEYYRRNPGEIFSLATLQAGGVFQGGLIVALLVAILYMRRKKLPPWETADCFAPGIALGHAIGRLGCFAAGCCWGARCDLPWKVVFTNPEANRLFGTPLNVGLHPSQLYESGAEAVIFALLWRAFGRPHAPGQIIALYLILYSGARFGIEFVRFHEQAPPFGGPLSLAQWISAVLLAGGLWLYLRRRLVS